jgi:magnesium-protoporphyrin O-methyltransferase
VGAIAHGLLQAGVRQAADVDASAAYLAAAREEAERRRLADRVTFQHGDFVALASAIAPADIVTLDRVICCYEDMPALVRLSAARAEKLYGVVYPRDPWWVRTLNGPYALIMRLLRTPLRFYIHSTTAVDALIRGQGFERRFYRKAGLWQIVVYARPQSRHGDTPKTSAASSASEASGREAAL